ncbi:MAG: hypothetical protein U5K56_18025 [Halioglobus sp.]|nr:hypothetical protein [Halioglobus sp.]
MECPVFQGDFVDAGPDRRDRTGGVEAEMLREAGPIETGGEALAILP